MAQAVEECEHDALALFRFQLLQAARKRSRLAGSHQLLHRPGRVVLLGSPFAGSNAAARLEASRIGTALLGRSIREWLLDRPQAWSGPRELGVIAGCGRIGMGRIIAPDLARPNDGVVAVAETRVPGAADHLVLPVSHTAMLASRRVAEESAHFLRNGRFRHEAEDERREKLGQALPEQQ